MRLTVLALVLAAAPAAADPALVAAARSQVGVTVIYDPAYVGLAFPMGDLPRDRGVCSDVIVRALRDGWGIDLQAAVNRDMKSAFAAYPALWGLRTTDRNIDHRRVPNLEVLFARIGAALPVSADPADYRPGDIVSFRLTGSGLAHNGIVDDARSADGARPLVTHNIGAGARTEDMLFDHPIRGHYRIEAEARARLSRLAG
jgi:uncharacterized protein YijF (DUF1287 family)